MDHPDDRVRTAVRHFWQTRKKQAGAQGSKTGKKDYGSRGESRHTPPKTGYRRHNRARHPATCYYQAGHGDEAPVQDFRSRTSRDADSGALAAGFLGAKESSLIARRGV
jgi:hypothetical protein